MHRRNFIVGTSTLSLASLYTLPASAQTTCVPTPPTTGIDVVAEIRDTLGRTGFPAHRLDVKITEGIFMSNAQAVIEVRQLFELDDFTPSDTVERFREIDRSAQK